MARYRKIDPRIWNDYKFLSLSIYGRMMFLFILTHPNMTFIGALRGTREGLARELASTAGSGEDLTGGTTEALMEAYAKGYDELLGKALVEEDKKSNFVYAKNFLKFNLPESPKVCISFRTALEFLPECDLLTVAMARAAKIIIENQSSSFVQALTKEFREAYEKVYDEAFPLDIALSKNYEQRAKKEEEKVEKETAKPKAKRELRPLPQKRRWATGERFFLTGSAGSIRRQASRMLHQRLCLRTRIRHFILTMSTTRMRSDLTEQLTGEFDDYGFV